jgi:hypothetical protein
MAMTLRVRIVASVTLAMTNRNWDRGSTLSATHKVYRPAGNGAVWSYYGAS